MRLIKFRIFKKGVMEYNPEILYGEHVDLNEQICGLLDNNYKVMQYTGLEDKNGVEIYEGDILLSDTGEIYSVEFFNGGFNAVHKDRKLSDIYPIWEYMDIFLCESVGNIYENRELLKNKKEKI